MESAKVEAVKVHEFERAGLGKAPFRCVGVERRVGPIRTPDGGEVGAPGQPMGTCDFCGTGIADCYVIRSADGREFIVGCDCVRKTGDAGLKREIAPHVNRLKREARAKAEGARIAAARATLDRPEVRAIFAARPHPLKWRAEKGETALDSLEWMMANAGNAGRIRVARTVEAAAKEVA